MRQMSGMITFILMLMKYEQPKGKGNHFLCLLPLICLNRKTEGGQSVCQNFYSNCFFARRGLGIIFSPFLFFFSCDTVPFVCMRDI